jgi:hypothetical protein
LGRAFLTIDSVFSVALCIAPFRHEAVTLFISEREIDVDEENETPPNFMFTAMCCFGCVYMATFMAI